MKNKQKYPYRNQLIFTFLFLLIAVLFMFIGFWKTILIVVLTTIGYIIGTMWDGNRSFFSILASIQAFFER
ncbi:DUF2273 domain-containing protein [Melissococcus plutonius]|uniref:Small integral membrane protein n=1 Tax=Melissococcus plutonius (strain ATCC 35311 / DSM 29964 / CIP 104052 / LMG 20360 / NCIMB 702443) TaxID=940190 RepID=F3YC55_MELPT|nr:DUF2273 domain-containing protein [Melissococcus plutonius]AIM25951.1 hypothetical protein MEPL_c015180 [Melissococcus plutonius S1]KMT24026.1 hypothetical protein MEPL2_3c02400 [Melissococcus plutonius]KMT24180.1 hypothetical protein MEPL3_7c00490 [Melissococcus plutonius]KMT25525.1 hypothetical protein MEPL1_7c00490 [Melissococcus plutonius]KMT28671.1 hypothetical protein MEPL4_5c02390 [Melissococcus plutonius]